MSEMQNVVVAALRPPMLAANAKISGYVKFLGLYEQYVSQGGTIPLRCCIPEGLRRAARAELSKRPIPCVVSAPSSVRAESKADGSAVEAKEAADAAVQWDSLPAEHQKQILHRLFCPPSMLVAKQALASISMESNTFDKSSVREHLAYVERFIDVCEGVLPDGKELTRLIVESLRPQAFVTWVTDHSGLRKRVPQLYDFINDLAAEYDAIVSQASAIGYRLESQKRSDSSSGGKPFRPNSKFQKKAEGAVAPITAGASKAASAKKPEGSSKRERWPANMCLGCGYVFDPPHRRDTCPFKSMPGWCKEGVPSSPMILKPGQISSIFSDDTSVSMVDGRIVAGVNGYYEVRVGLDTMCCMSLIHPRVLKELNRVNPLSRKQLPEPRAVTTAGTSKPYVITHSVCVTLLLGDVDCPASIEVTLGVMPIPADILIGWSDLCRFDLMPLIGELASVHSPRLAAAPEEYNEASDVVAAGVAVMSVSSPSVSSATCDVAPVEDAGTTLHPAFAELLASELATEVMCDELPAEGSKIPPMTLELIDPNVLPKSFPPRRQSDAISAFIDDTVARQLSLGHIVPSTSPVAAPVVVSRPPNRAMRLCIDYQHVNSCTKSMKYPLPNLKGIIDRMKGYAYYATLDLRKGYHQVLMDPQSRYLTAFVTSKGQYEYTRVPFGLKNAPAYFQHALSCIVLAGLVNVICEVYIDDIVVYGNDMSELAQRVRLVMERLREYRLRLNREKCRFGLPEIEYLGYHVSARGIRLSDSKKQGLLALAAPCNPSQLRSFLGLANYFRDFIPQYSSRAAYLYRLAAPRAKFVWDDVAQSAFEDIKSAVSHAPMLHHIDYGLPIVLRTDASTMGVGAVLLNIAPDGSERIIAFLSQRFSDTATRWSTLDQEGYAIFFGVKGFSHYVRGHWFILDTDHNNLRYIQQATEGKVARWRLLLQEYDFIVRHIAGESNVVADCLSRCCSIVDNSVDSV